MMQADTALYHAKRAGRDQFCYFSSSMSERAAARLRLESDLRARCRTTNYSWSTSPRCCGRNIGSPAWRPGALAARGWQPCDAGRFHPGCRGKRPVTPLDEWVMREACRQNKEWQDAGVAFLPVSVNVSLARFDPERLLAHVRGALQASGLEPRWLQIEFTESQMFADEERAHALIEGLHALGVQIALDDFGTGYSSLRYLLQYRFNTLKVDSSFVSGLPGDVKQGAVVQAIVAMARALQADVVAEGVETLAQAEAWRRTDARKYRVTCTAHPLPAHAFSRLLRQPLLQPSDSWPARATTVP